MKKKWNVITIVSLALILIEAILLFVLVLPAVRMNAVFKALNEADGEKAAECAEKLSDGQSDKLETLLDDFATYQCNRYVSDEITYQELSEYFDAVEEIDGYSDFRTTYMDEIGYAILIDIYEEAVACYETDSDRYDELLTEYYGVYYVLSDTSYADEKLIEYVDVRFQEFLSGDLTTDEINLYLDVAYYIFSGDAWDYVYDLSYYRLDNIISYREEYEELQTAYEEKDYITVIERCDEISVDEDDTEYAELYKTLREDAYEAGKTYYVEYAQSLVDSGDNAGATEVIEMVEEVYGSDIDMTSVTDSMKADWMDPYALFMSDYGENVRNSLATATSIDEYNDCAVVLADIDNYEPTVFVLHDFDGNGTPEMMLVGENATYIYTYDGSNVVLTGCMSFYDFGYDSTIITDFSIVTPEGLSEGYGLMKYENNTWTVVETCMAFDDGTYLVNGNSATEEEATDVYNDIASYQDKETSDNIDYCYIDDSCVSFIYSYE